MPNITLHAMPAMSHSARLKNHALAGAGERVRLELHLIWLTRQIGAFGDKSISRVSSCVGECIAGTLKIHTGIMTTANFAGRNLWLKITLVFSRRGRARWTVSMDLQGLFRRLHGNVRVACSPLCGQ
jgi:hypothetical protein